MKFPLRLIELIFHSTGLERLYKPRFLQRLVGRELDSKLVARLPKYSESVTGVQNEPVNLILLGSEDDIKRSFEQAGWYSAAPASPFHVLYSLVVVVLNRSYKRGPFSPLYINGNLQDMAFQRPTDENNFRLRHHLRIWQTGMLLSSGRQIWVVTASFDASMRLSWALPFVVHNIDPDLDRERQFVVDTLVAVGAREIKRVKLTDSLGAKEPGHNVFGSPYFTDGRAAVVEL